jgi:hypothetical protein
MKQKTKSQPYIGNIKIGNQFRIKSDNNIIEVVDVNNNIVCKYIVSDTKKDLPVTFGGDDLDKKVKFGYFIKIK